MDRSDARPFLIRAAALFALAAVFGVVLTAGDPGNRGAYTTGAVPVVLVTAYVLVTYAEEGDFPRFLAVSAVIVALVYFVGTVVAPPGVGLGPGWTTLAAAFVAAYAIVYGPDAAVLSDSN
jgi:hypothetical protein